MRHLARQTVCSRRLSADFRRIASSLLLEILQHLSSSLLALFGTRRKYSVRKPFVALGVAIALAGVLLGGPRLPRDEPRTDAVHTESALEVVPAPGPPKVGPRPRAVWRAPSAPASGDTGRFVHVGVRFRSSLWLGGFEDGLYRLPLDHDELPASAEERIVAVPSPLRMVNRLVATEQALFVASNEGLYVSRDEKTFQRVPQISARAVTGLALTARSLWVASSEAVYRLDRSGRGRILATYVYPAGTHAIQALSVESDDVVWLATEDRGVVRIDSTGARAFDRLAALPSSWFVAVEADGHGGVLAASLRHGSVHLAADGSWSPLAWAEGAWGLGIARVGDEICVGTQSGASCKDARGVTRLAGLPDLRVHFVLRQGASVLVGTEGGLAFYDAW